jgi:hypothetical protein
MSAARAPIVRLVEQARATPLDALERHALMNLLDALGVPVEPREPGEWR